MKVSPKYWFVHFHRLSTSNSWLSFSVSLFVNRLAASNPPPVFDVITGMTGLPNDDSLWQRCSHLYSTSSCKDTNVVSKKVKRSYRRDCPRATICYFVSNCTKNWTAFYLALCNQEMLVQLISELFPNFSFFFGQFTIATYFCGRRVARNRNVTVSAGICCTKKLKLVNAQERKLYHLTFAVQLRPNIFLSNVQCNKRLWMEKTIFYRMLFICSQKSIFAHVLFYSALQ